MAALLFCDVLSADGAGPWGEFIADRVAAGIYYNGRRAASVSLRGPDPSRTRKVT